MKFSNIFSSLISTIERRKRVLSELELSSFYDWVSAQPKVETHVHLEAAVHEEFYRSRPAPSEWSEHVPWERAPFESLRGFIRAWVDLSRSIRQLSDFEDMASAFVAKRAEERILYTEAYISPADFSFIRERFAIAPEIFNFEDVVRAYCRGLRRGLSLHKEVQARLVVDALWISNSLERENIFKALTNVLAADDCKDEHGAPIVVAVGLGGMENHQQLEEQKNFFERIRALGLKVDIHSGEGGDAETHKTTLAQLKPDRVAHGFAGWSDKFIFQDNLVMCPLSNILLKTFAGEPDEHPVFECLEKGLPVAIGSDDPLLLGTSLALEYTFLHALTGKGEDIFNRTQNSARARVLDRGALQNSAIACD